MTNPELLRLLDYSLGFAKKQLAKRGECPPFAATIAPDGVLEPLLTTPGFEALKPPERIIEYGKAWMSRTAQGRASAVSVCFDSRLAPEYAVGDEAESIAVILEHVNGEYVTVYLPYNKGRLWGFSYGATTAVRRERAVFPVVRS